MSVGRRGLLRASLLGGAGLAAAALIGCGDDDDDDAEATATATAAATEEATSTAEATATPEVATTDGFPKRLQEIGGDPKRGGIFNHGHSISVSNIDPIVSAAGGTVSTPNVVYDRLVGFHKGFDVSFTELEIEPELAASWETSEDGLEMTFNVTEGITWQNVDPLNGRDFTAEDLAYAYTRYLSEESAHKGLIRKITSAEAVDPTTLKLTLSEPWPDALTVLGQRFLTIFPKELVDDETISSRAIGTGPFILDEIREDGGASFSRNPDFWGPEVYLDGYNLISIADASARLARYRVGQLDHAESLIGTPSEANQLLSTNPDVRITDDPPTYAIFSVSVNLSLPKYQDERVRQALSTGMDRQLIIDVALEGAGRSLPYMPWTYVLDEEPGLEDIPWFAYNPDEAKKLLAAAGASDLKIDMIYYNYAPSSNSSQNEIIQQSYRELGLDFTIASVDYTEFNSSWIPGEFADAADGWGPQGQHADNYWYDQIVSTSPGNRWNIDDAQVDEWAAAQSVELDPSVRREIQKQIWDRMTELAYRIEKPYRSTLVAYQPYLRGAFFEGLNGANASYYDMGHMLPGVWLDK
jgi:peptide/nickel transport system substrate-binding protein